MMFSIKIHINGVIIPSLYFGYDMGGTIIRRFVRATPPPTRGPPATSAFPALNIP